MRVGLCAGFREPLSPPDWQLLYELTWCGIRQDIPSLAKAPDLISNMVGRGMSQNIALQYVRGTVDESLALAENIALCVKATGQTDSVALELGNEENIVEEGTPSRWVDDPEGYGKLVAKIVDRVAPVNPAMRIVTAGVSSTSLKSLAWLAAALRHVPPHVSVGFHSYRSTPPGVALKGYASREAEFAALRELAEGRPLWCTEVGWSTASRPKAFPLCFLRESWSDGEVASFLRSEIRINEQAGIEAVYIFQLQDGLGANERFGIRRRDGTLKPQARVALEMRT